MNIDVYMLFCNYGFDEVFLKNEKIILVCSDNLFSLSRKSNGLVIFGMNQNCEYLG